MTVRSSDNKEQVVETPSSPTLDSEHTVTSKGVSHDTP